MSTLTADVLLSGPEAVEYQADTHDLWLSLYALQSRRYRKRAENRATPKHMRIGRLVRYSEHALDGWVTGLDAKAFQPYLAGRSHSKAYSRRFQQD